MPFLIMGFTLKTTQRSNFDSFFPLKKKKKEKEERENPEQLTSWGEGVPLVVGQ